MLAFRSGPRMTTVTGLPDSARNTAAWPAELPPPTTTTGDCGALPGFDRGGRVVHALALEVGEPVDVESPVAGAGGDDHRAAGDLGSVGEADDEVPGLLPQRGGCARGGEVRAELLRLHQGPLGQVAAGDAGREPEVVLDARAGAGLSAGRDHVDAQGSQPLGRAVDRGGQPGRAAADDDEVEAAVGQVADGQAEVLGQRTRRRPAQHRSRHDHDGKLGRGDAELAQQTFDGVVVVGVQPLVRDPAAGQELPHPLRLGGEPRAHDPDGRRRAAEQHGPASHEGGEDRVAQAGLCREHPSQVGRRHDDHLARLGHPGRHEHPQAGEHVQLAQEPAGAVTGDDPLLAVGCGSRCRPRRRRPRRSRRLASPSR